MEVVLPPSCLISYEVNYRPQVVAIMVYEVSVILQYELVILQLIIRDVIAIDYYTKQYVYSYELHVIVNNMHLQ